MRWILRVVLVSFLGLMVSHSVLAASEPTGVVAVAVITGRVILEINSAPLSDIAIRLIDPDSPDEVIDAATTDINGLYTVTQPISNTWIVRFESKQAPSAYTPVPEYYDDSLSIEGATLITAEVGTVTANINAALATPFQLTGHVSAEEGGAPIGNVQVAAIGPGPSTDRMFATSDTSGAYTFTLFSAGDYRIFLDPPNSDVYALEYYPHKKRLEDAEIVKVEEGKAKRLDVALVRGGVIAGRVTSSLFGRDIELPAAIVLEEHGEVVQIGNRYSDLPDEGGPHDSAGFYHAYNMPPGGYQVRFEATNHATFLQRELVTVVAGRTTTNIDAQLVLTAQVGSIATSPAVPNMIALTIAQDPSPIVTLDGGLSWQLLSPDAWLRSESLYAYPDRSPNPAIVTALAPRGGPTDGTRIVVGAPRLSYEEIEMTPGLFRSGDNGQSWAQAQVAPEVSKDECFGSFFQRPVITPAAPDHLYVIRVCDFFGHGRLYVSDNAGVSWQDVTEEGGRTLVLFGNARLVVSPFVKDELYAYDGASKWYESTDGGHHWQDKALPVESFVFDSQKPNYLYGWTPRTGGPYNRTGKRSRDGGVTWEDWEDQACPNTYADEPPLLLADARHGEMLYMRCDNDLTTGIYRSDNGGVGWRKMADGVGQFLVTDYGTPGRILWAKDDGLWASSDLGESWQMLLRGYVVAKSPVYLPAVMVGP